jgi:hypothetical protein
MLIVAIVVLVIILLFLYDYRKLSIGVALIGVAITGSELTTNYKFSDGIDVSKYFGGINNPSRKPYSTLISPNNTSENKTTTSPNIIRRIFNRFTSNNTSNENASKDGKTFIQDDRFTRKPVAPSQPSPSILSPRKQYSNVIPSKSVRMTDDEVFPKSPVKGDITVGRVYIPSTKETVYLEKPNPNSTSSTDLEYKAHVSEKIDLRNMTDEYKKNALSVKDKIAFISHANEQKQHVDEQLTDITAIFDENLDILKNVNKLKKTAESLKNSLVKDGQTETEVEDIIKTLDETATIVINNESEITQFKNREDEKRKASAQSEYKISPVSDIIKEKNAKEQSFMDWFKKKFV